jgi:hypothetical protein
MGFKKNYHHAFQHLVDSVIENPQNSSELIPYATLTHNCTGTGTKLNGYVLMMFSHIWVCPGNKLSTSALLRLIEGVWRAYRWVLMRET